MEIAEGNIFQPVPVMQEFERWEIFFYKLFIYFYLLGIKFHRNLATAEFVFEDEREE